MIPVTCARLCRYSLGLINFVPAHRGCILFLILKWECSYNNIHEL